MTAVSTWNVQTAVHALLQADAPLTALIGSRIYNNPPNNADDFPYVSHGAEVGTRDRTSSADGLELVATIDVWSRYPGTKEVKQIMHAITEALDRQDLTVTGLSSCICFIDSAQTLPVAANGEAQHGVIRARFMCRE